MFDSPPPHSGSAECGPERSLTTSTPRAGDSDLVPTELDTTAHL
ncbi:hypothetical protein [Streptomyces phage phiScoe25]|nr:hypothetical protein [Streptomyces phage phiScoe25]